MNYLPNELVADILRRLPVSSVVQCGCGCGCKSWYDLIRNPNFILSHFHNTQPQQQHVVHKFSLYKADTITLLFETGDYSRPQHLQLPCLFCFQVSGSCNGILCFVHSHGEHIQFMLYNPSIQRSVWLPNPRHSKRRRDCVFVGFGFDAAANNHKILKFDSKSAEIYSFNSNCWRDISVPEFSHGFNRFGAFANGALHWIVAINGENVVIAFDVKAETFQLFSLTSRFARCSQYEAMLNVVEYGGTSIAVTLKYVLSRNRSDIVVMKEYGVIDSWEHLATICKTWWEYLDVLGFRGKDQLLIISGSGDLVSQKLNQEIVTNLISASKHEGFCVHKYVPSLFLLDKENNAPARIHVESLKD